MLDKTRHMFSLLRDRRVSIKHNTASFFALSQNFHKEWLLIKSNTSTKPPKVDSLPTRFYLPKTKDTNSSVDTQTYLLVFKKVIVQIRKMDPRAQKTSY